MCASACRLRRAWRICPFPRPKASFPAAASPAGRKPPWPARLGLRKQKRSRPPPEQLARRLLKPPRDLGKDRRFNPIPIHCANSALHPDTIFLHFGLWISVSGFPPIHGSMPRRPPLPPAPPPPRAASPVCSTADAGHAYASCRTVVSSGSGASRCGLCEFDHPFGLVFGDE